MPRPPAETQLALMRVTNVITVGGPEQSTPTSRRGSAQTATRSQLMNPER